MASSRRQYPFHLIEPKWQNTWDEQHAFRAFNPGDDIPATHPFALRHQVSGKVAAAQLPPKFYILDMFPYPSGAGLHVGHPEGYTATDILARYRRACGFNVLHPMGWDSFGLPAEQYAVKTGQHPRVTTEANIANFTRQIKSLGFSYDWTRELATTDPDYFKWTQWIFLKLYNSWFNPETNRAEPIETLKYPAELSSSGFQPETVGQASSLPDVANGRQDACPTPTGRMPVLLADELAARRRAYRDSKRLAYVSEQPVWWCEQLGTVLANEEVVDGKSEVGGFPVVRKPMRQWMLRITAYAEKLLADLDTIDWTDSLKEMQRNWIGRSEGAEVDFAIADCELPIADSKIRVFTTRPDTLFGATYMVLSPEHKLVPQITTAGQQQAVEAYRTSVSGKSDLERTELAKEKTGVFTGAYAINPVNGEKIPIWIADYVLASYGTGAIMAVPAHDERDFEFATKFALPIVQVVKPSESDGARAVPALSATASTGAQDTSEALVASDPLRPGTGRAPCEAFCEPGVAVNSANPEISITGLPTAEAKKKITAWLDAKGLGKKTVNFKLRDWLFSRQRYWGEPFPIVWKRDASGQLYHEAVPEKSLPVLPPSLTDYKPTATGEPPLARAKEWVELKGGATRETNTMPQWAGSCWYYLRYLDTANATRFTGREVEQYWMGGERPAGVFPLLAPECWRDEVSHLWQRAFADGKRPPYAVDYAAVSATLAEMVRQSTGMDVEGFHHSLDVYALRHTFNEHGNPTFEEARGNLAVTREDVERLPEILAAPDSVEFGAKHPDGLKRLIITKRINGSVVVVEEIRGRHRLLQLVTMYKRKTTARDVAPKAPLSDTSETFRRSTENKPSAGPAVKPTPGVDLYVGGTEHAVLHLLYARFWHKVLFDLGQVSTPEPFFKLVNQGLILGEDGQKMSKARGNVVNPDDMVQEFGADSLRLYEMFMGPLQDVKPWNTQGVAGVYKFLGRVWRLFVDEQSETEFEQAETTTKEQSSHELLNLVKLHAAIKDVEPTAAQLKTLHACIKKVTEDLDGMRFNTAISALMVFVNEAIPWETKPVSVLRSFLQLLAPFAPHLAEELWERVHATRNPQPAPSLAYAVWPKHDPSLLVESELEIPVQVNGKLRDVIRVPAGADNATLEAAARAAEKAQPFLAGKTIKKVIVVPRKLVNLIAV